MRLRCYSFQFLTFLMVLSLLSCGGGSSEVSSHDVSLSSDEHNKSLEESMKLKVESSDNNDGNEAKDKTNRKDNKKKSSAGHKDTPNDNDSDSGRKKPQEDSVEVTFLESPSLLQEALFSSTFKNAAPIHFARQNFSEKNLNLVKYSKSSSFQRLLQSEITEINFKKGNLLTEFFKVLSQDPNDRKNYLKTLEKMVNLDSNKAKLLSSFKFLYNNELSRMIIIDNSLREGHKGDKFILILTRHKEAFSLFDDFLEEFNKRESKKQLNSLEFIKDSGYSLALASPKSFKVKKSQPYIEDAKVLIKNTDGSWGFQIENIDFMQSYNLLKEGDEISVGENNRKIKPVYAYLSLKPLDSNNVFTLNFLTVKTNSSGTIKSSMPYLGIVREHHTVDWLNDSNTQAQDFHFIDDKISTHVLKYFKNNDQVTKINQFNPSLWSSVNGYTYSVPFTYTEVLFQENEKS